MNMPNLINLYKLDEFGEHDVGDNLRDLQALKKCQTGRWMSRDELNANCKALFWEQKSSSHNHKLRSVQTLETEICKWREVEMFPIGVSELNWELLGSSAFLPRTGGPKRTGLSRHGNCPLRHRWPQRFWTTWSFLKYEGLKVSRCLKSIQYPDPVSVSKPEKEIEIESKKECCGAFPVTAGLHPNHLRKRKLAPSCWNKAPPTGTSSPIYLNGQTFLPGRVAESRKYCGSLHFKHLQKCS